MAISDYFNAVCAISREGVSGIDAGGMTTGTLSTVASGVACRIESLSGLAMSNLGQVAISENLEVYDYIGYFSASQDIEKHDTVVVSSGPITGTFVAERKLIATTDLTSAHHIEVYLKEVA